MAKPLIRLLKWGTVAAIALLMPRSTQRQLMSASATSERTDHTATLTDQPLTNPNLNDLPCAELTDFKQSDAEQIDPEPGPHDHHHA